MFAPFLLLQIAPDELEHASVVTRQNKTKQNK